MKELTLIEKAFCLKNISIFKDLDLDLLLAIADKMHQDIYDKNEKVFEINQIGKNIYFIEEGAVQILDENNNEIKTLQQNDFFGDESLFSDQPRAYGVTCSEDTLLLSLSKTNFYGIISECPTVAISLLNAYSLSKKNRNN